MGIGGEKKGSEIVDRVLEEKERIKIESIKVRPEKRGDSA